MARAMIDGLIASGFSPRQIRAVDPCKTALGTLADRGLSQLDTDPQSLLKGVDLLITPKWTRRLMGNGGLMVLISPLCVDIDIS